MLNLPPHSHPFHILSIVDLIIATLIIAAWLRDKASLPHWVVMVLFGEFAVNAVLVVLL